MKRRELQRITLHSQYIGNLGKTENGIVCVNAYALVDNITIPLLFKIFKPRHRLKKGDVYKTKPQLAEEIIRELLAFEFKFKRVLADSLYGESGNVIRVLEELNLNFIVAIRSNHGVLVGPGQRVRYNTGARLPAKAISSSTRATLYSRNYFWQAAYHWLLRNYQK